MLLGCSLEKEQLEILGDAHESMTKQYRPFTSETPMPRPKHVQISLLSALLFRSIETRYHRQHSFFLYSYYTFLVHYSRFFPTIMASATRLPLKSIAFTTAVVVAAGASKVSFKNLAVSTFTGPGSYSRIVATLIVLANLKNGPFVWHVCNLPSPEAQQ